MCYLGGEKFLSAKRPEKKLEIALTQFLGDPGEALPEEWEKIYRDYIGGRLYPSLRLLVRRGDHLRLRRFLELGSVDGALYVNKALRKRALFEEAPQDAETRAILLAWDSQEECGGTMLSAGDRQEGHENSLHGVSLLKLWAKRLGMAQPGLRLTLAALVYREAGPAEGDVLGTDGRTVVFSENKLNQLRQENGGYRCWLHMMLHCLFSHINTKGIPRQDRDLWELACDISAETLAVKFFPSYFEDNIWVFRRRLGLPPEFPLHSAPALFRYLRGQAHGTEKAGIFREERGTGNRIPKTGIEGQGLGKDSTTQAGLIGNAKSDCPTAEDLKTLAQMCRRDDHWLWYGTGQSRQRAEVLEGWRQAASGFGQGGSGGRERFGLAAGSRREKMELREEGQYHFGPYLKRFSVTREELQLDLDGFDYIPYYYGMERYGNLPFLEPLEYTEAYKIEELAIAIDTSGSCSTELVRRFLGETRRLLTAKEHFFKKMRVYIIQCDSMIQDVAFICSAQEWNSYEDGLSIMGRGGTNFTPVFELVKRMTDEGKIRKLKGLLYFTDGDGVYPREETPYETAFVFPDYRFLEYHVPEWVHRLCLEWDPGDISEK